MTLYHLILHDPESSRDDYDETFFIGVFMTEKEAEQTARRFLANVPGFKDYPCVYSIHEKPLHGETVQGDRVYWVQGWNWNENQDETDIVESDDFAGEADAEAALAEMRRKQRRAEWRVLRASPGKCDWQEGFDRDSR